MPDVYIGIGSNLGNRILHLAQAREAIAVKVGAIVHASSIYDTAPWGPVPQENYLNQVICISTTLSPRALLDQLHEIERAAGRDRKNEVRFGPRTLDLDILIYGERTIDEDGLTIPHPRIGERAFVLVPLAEIAPQVLVAGRPAGEVLRQVDAGSVRRYDPH
jgi:2-amino-4-hydroxy-6-hydroxymethyldihydropteridine diphosphokinase